MVQEVGGGDGGRVNLGIREQVTVVFVSAIKPEGVESIFACVGGGVVAAVRRGETPRLGKCFVTLA